MLSRFIESTGVSSDWLTLAAAGVAVIAYFLGCFNGAVVVSRYILRNDIRGHGSGNAGLTNFYRVFGGPLTLVVILSDVVKAILAVTFAVFIAEHISPELVILAKYWAGTFCLLGHMYPCTFQFRGGKGILSGGTIAIMIGIGGENPYSWCVPAVVWGGFLILFVLTRYVSLGSCWTGFSFPFVSWCVYRDILILLLAILVGGLILWKHRGNMVRLVKGTESRFTFHKKPAAEDTPEPAGDHSAEDAPGEESAPEASEGLSAEGAAEELTGGPENAVETAPEEPAAEAAGEPRDASGTDPEEPSAEAAREDKT